MFVLCVASAVVSKFDMVQQRITQFFKVAAPVRQEQVPNLPKVTLNRANDAVIAEESGQAAAQASGRKRGSYNHVNDSCIVR